MILGMLMLPKNYHVHFRRNTQKKLTEAEVDASIYLSLLGEVMWTPISLASTFVS